MLDEMEDLVINDEFGADAEEGDDDDVAEIQAGSFEFTATHQGLQ